MKLIDKHVESEVINARLEVMKNFLLVFMKLRSC